VDKDRSGDRQSDCHSLMKPIGLTFKKEGVDRYGKPRQGEIMIVHQCLGCGKISINRIAGDDDPDMILKIFEDSQKMDLAKKKLLKEKGIRILEEKDKKEILAQLFGKTL